MFQTSLNSKKDLLLKVKIKYFSVGRFNKNVTIDACEFLYKTLLTKWFETISYLCCFYFLCLDVPSEAVEGPFYTQLGSGSSLEEVKKIMENR